MQEGRHTGRPSQALASASALHHPAHVRHAGADRNVLLRCLGDDRLGGEDVLRDRRSVLQRRAGDHRRIADPALEQILDLAGLDVQAEALLRRPHLLDDDRALEARVVRELAERLLESAEDDLRTRLLVALELAEKIGADRIRGVDERDTATRNLALFEGRAGSLQRVLDAVLLLHLRLGRSADLDDGDAARQLREALLELLAVEVGVGVLDLGLQLLDAALDRLRVAGPVDDRRRVLVDDDATGVAELRELRVLELEAHLLGDHLAAREDRDVLEHALTAIAEARRLDRDGLEGAAELVDDDRGKRLALDVLRDDQERPAGLDDLLEHRQEILDRADLLVGDEDVGILEHRLHPLGVGDHVRREVALVELHALGEFELEAERLPLLDVHDTVLPDLLDRVGDDVADLPLARGDGGDAGDVLAAGDVLRLRLEVLHDALDRGLDAALEAHRVRAGGDVLQPLADDRLREDGRRRRPVAGNVVRRRRDLADELRALVLENILELDLAGDRDAVVRDRGCAELLVKDYVAPLGTQRDLDRVGEDIDTALERAACVLVELQLLVSHLSSNLRCSFAYAVAPAGSRVPWTFARTSDSRRIRYSSVPTLISVPPYLEKTISSPSSTSIGTNFPLSSREPGPTARTRPRCGFSFAVSGSTMPLNVCSSSSRTSTIRRSPSGFRFIRAS